MQGDVVVTDQTVLLGLCIATGNIRTSSSQAMNAGKPLRRAPPALSPQKHRQLEPSRCHRTHACPTQPMPLPCCRFKACSRTPIVYSPFPPCVE
jgi:hypothetical protein